MSFRTFFVVLLLLSLCQSALASDKNLKTPFKRRGIPFLSKSFTHCGRALSAIHNSPTGFIVTYYFILGGAAVGGAVYLLMRFGPKDLFREREVEPHERIPAYRIPRI